MEIVTQLPSHYICAEVCSIVHCTSSNKCSKSSNLQLDALLNSLKQGKCQCQYIYFTVTLNACTIWNNYHQWKACVCVCEPYNESCSEVMIDQQRARAQCCHGHYIRSKPGARHCQNRHQHQRPWTQSSSWINLYNKNMSASQTLLGNRIVAYIFLVKLISFYNIHCFKLSLQKVIL